MPKGLIIGMNRLTRRLNGLGWTGPGSVRTVLLPTQAASKLGWAGLACGLELKMCRPGSLLPSHFQLDGFGFKWSIFGHNLLLDIMALLDLFYSSSRVTTT